MSFATGERRSFKLSRIQLNSETTLVGILLVCFLLVSFTIRNYGASFDEFYISNYADRLTQVYIGQASNQSYQALIRYQDLMYYGPAYWMFANITSRPILEFFPSLDRFDAGHIINFATFLIGVWCLFRLSRRFASPLASLVASLLYLTQPLLWGHGVMNPKDSPFSTFFLITVLCGFRMVEEFSHLSSPKINKPFNEYKTWQIYLVGLILLLACLTLVDLLTGQILSRIPVSNLVHLVDSANPGSLLQTIFRKLADHSNTTLATAYSAKILKLVYIAEFICGLLVTASLIIFWFCRTSPRNRWIVLAGVSSGLTVAIRVLGPAAMGLVAVYGLSRLGRKCIAPLLVSTGISFIVIYISWPYLWDAPLKHLLESLQRMTNFPWDGPVRFEGRDWPASALPWYYLPKLLAIQLTLPLIGLAGAGLLISFRAALKRHLPWGLACIPWLWFLVPLSGIMLAHPVMYDNFRQALFILPPLFLLAAVAIDSGLVRIKSKALGNILCLATLLPGIIAGLWLYPYQYVYYNGLVGWTGQVQRAYEGDYWFTAMCEASRYMHATAPEGATIAFTYNMPLLLFRRCQDNNDATTIEGSEVTQINPDYSILQTRDDDDLNYFQKMSVIKTIGRGSTVFAVIKKAP